MADDDNEVVEADETEKPKKGLGLPVTLAGAAVLAAVSGAAAFALAPAGGGGGAKDTEKTEKHADDGHGDKKADKKADKKGKGKDKKKKKGKGKDGHDEGGGGAVYVPLEPIIVSLGPEAMANRLKITLVIEGASEYEQDLIKLIPKFRDVLNTYLRAADARDFESPAAMSRVRAHIARRMRIVAPDASIKSVLVTDFILD
ncbi:MAG: flagellar basal body-associated FliL family protein [Pseudomonadota bacterium]